MNDTIDARLAAIAPAAQLSIDPVWVELEPGDVEEWVRLHVDGEFVVALPRSDFLAAIHAAIEDDRCS